MDMEQVRKFSGCKMLSLSMLSTRPTLPSSCVCCQYHDHSPATINNEGHLKIKRKEGNPLYKKMFRILSNGCDGSSSPLPEDQEIDNFHQEYSRLPQSVFNSDSMENNILLIEDQIQFKKEEEDELIMVRNNIGIQDLNEIITDIANDEFINLQSGHLGSEENSLDFANLDAFNILEEDHQEISDYVGGFNNNIEQSFQLDSFPSIFPTPPSATQEENEIFSSDDQIKIDDEFMSMRRKSMRIQKQQEFSSVCYNEKWMIKCQKVSMVNDLSTGQSMKNRKNIFVKKEFKCLHPGCSYFTAKRKFLVEHQTTMNHQDGKHEQNILQKVPAPVSKFVRPNIKQRTYRCNNQGCSYVTTYMRNLRNHQKVHSGEKCAFSCTYSSCNYTTSNIANFDKHIRIHKGEKPYKCAYDGCTYASIQKFNVVVHMRTHSGEKPFKCQVCEYSARTKDHLIHHMKNHNKEDDKKPLICPQQEPLCNFICYSNELLIKHLKIHGLVKEEN